MPVLIILVILGVALFWALCVFGFRPLGKFISKIGGDIKGTMTAEEFDEDNEEDDKED